MPSRWAGFDDTVQGTFTLSSKCLDSVKGDTLFFSLDLTTMDLGPVFAEIS